jgi:hypothetical protein
MAAAGMYNVFNNPKTAGPNFGNNPNNPPFIAKGVRDYFGSSYGPPATIPDNSFQGSPALATPVDRFKTAFDRPFKGTSDDFNRLAGSEANGNITPSVGFADPTNANRYAGSFPQAMDDVTSSGRDGWLSSMLRNGEVERIMRDNGIAQPPISASPDNSAAFGDRFGKWGSSPAGVAQPPAPDRPQSFDNRFGNWDSAPAGGFGDTRSPVLRALQNYKRSATPDGPVSTSAQGAPLAAPNLPIGESAFGGRSENAPGALRPDINSRPASYRVSSAFPDITPRKPEKAALPPERAPLLGIFSGKPMSPSPFPSSVWSAG